MQTKRLARRVAANLQHLSRRNRNCRPAAVIERILVRDERVQRVVPAAQIDDHEVAGACALRPCNIAQERGGRETDRESRHAVAPSPVDPDRAQHRRSVPADDDVEALEVIQRRGAVIGHRDGHRVGARGRRGPAERAGRSIDRRARSRRRPEGQRECERLGGDVRVGQRGRHLPQGRHDAPEPGKRLGVIRGDFGNSLVNKRPVLQLISERIPNTLLLMVTAALVIIIFSLMIGVYSAIKPYTFFDNFVTALSFVGYSMPIFLIALLSMYLFSINFKEWGLPYLPPGSVSAARDYTMPVLGHIKANSLIDQSLRLILPTITLSLLFMAGWSRYTRSSMLEVMRQDYIRTARAKGLGERIVVSVHMLKNALIPVVTILGPALAALVTGSFIIETIFGFPGMGRAYVQSIGQRDYSMIMGTTVIYALLVAVANLGVDILYGFIDPRIRLE